MVVTKSTIALLLFAIVSAASTVAYRGATATDRLPAHADLTISPFAPVREPVGLDPGKVALGRRLFLDPIISGKNALTCDSCHDLNKGGTVGSRRTIGYQGKMHRFNAPTIFNVGNNYRLGWRGDFTSLEEQNEKVLLDENLMAVDWPTLLARLRSSEAYGSLFKSAYGRRADRDSVLDALATFQRSLVTTDAPFDRYLTGDQQAISEEAIRGFELFRTYGCSSCHQGSNIGGNMFQKFGIFAEALAKGENVSDGDLGRWTITGVDRDIGVFRVPSLRNVEVTAPYFHDGRTDTLAEAVEIMARSQLGREVSPVDMRAIVAFLEALTGEYNGRKLSASPLEERP